MTEISHMTEDQIAEYKEAFCLFDKGESLQINQVPKLKTFIFLKKWKRKLRKTR